MALPHIRMKVRKDGTRRYYAVVDIGADPETGDRRQRQRSWDTRKEAERGLPQWLVEIGQGVAVDHSALTVAGLFDLWLAEKERQGLLPNTLAGYRISVQTHIAPRLGRVRAQALAPAMIQRFYAQMQAAGHSPRVIYGCHRRLRQAFTMAYRLEIVPRNVTDAVTPPRLPRTEREPWTRPQVLVFLAVADQHAMRPLWTVEMHSGMRLGELVALRWRDVTLDGDDAGLVRIRQAVSVEKGGLRFRDPKTPTSRRAFRLPPSVTLALKLHAVRQHARRRLVGDLWRDNDLIFAGAFGDPLHPDTVRRHYKRLCREACVPAAHFHDLRHTYTTHMVAAGASLQTLARRLGHASADVTLDIYTHAVAEKDAEIAALSERLFSPLLD